MIRLVFASLINRRVIVFLTALSVALSVFLFASVEKLRDGARASFTHTVSGTHIVAGARSGQIPLLLFSLFHLGSPTSNVSYASYMKYRKHPAVAWALPLSIGDSHRGFRVVGTSPFLMKYYRYRNGQQLKLAEGSYSLARFKAVLGSTAARELGYKVGAPLVLTHGISDVQGIHDHEESPFTVEGIFEPTGTPFDKGIYISLESAELMHDEHGAEHAEGKGQHDHQADPVKIEKITSFMIGVKQPVDILPLMRAINEDTAEPLTAILPGVVLSEIWSMMGYAENILKLVSYLVMLTALCGLFIALYASLAERYREMAILRALGAHPGGIASLLVAESLLLALAGIAAGYGLLALAAATLHSTLLRYFSVSLGVFPLTGQELFFVAILIVMSVLVAMVPAYLVYRRALSEGLQVRQ
ncbi:MAG TPA: ABC transporter permease [Turneriella sp.]|nr:ABC transporter permease [Turneriella sp.]HNL11070.1 ABC transporter permease [Turneriella sp.]